MSADPQSLLRLCLLAVALALAGCGDGGGSSGTQAGTGYHPNPQGTPVATATATATASPTATATAVPTTAASTPTEEAGDEAGNRVTVEVTLGVEDAVPAEVKIPAFLALHLKVTNESGGERILELAGKTILELLPGEHGVADHEGLQPGQWVIEAGQSGRVILNAERPGKTG